MGSYKETLQEATKEALAAQDIALCEEYLDRMLAAARQGKWHIVCRNLFTKKQLQFFITNEFGVYVQKADGTWDEVQAPEEAYGNRIMISWR